MAKTKKTTEKQPEVLGLRRTGRKRVNTSRPSIVFPPEKPKKTKEVAAASTSAKTRSATAKSTTAKSTTTKSTAKPNPKTKAKSKEKSDQPASKASSKKQTKIATSTPKANTQQSTNSRNETRRLSGPGHGDLLASMKPLSIRLNRIYAKTGGLQRNIYTSIIQKDWYKYRKELSSLESNTALKGIEYFPYQTLRLQEKNGVTFADYEIRKDANVRVGVIILEPGKKKKSSIAQQYIRFTVLCGKANLKSDGISEQFKPGSVFTVPPNVKYYVKNASDAPVYLNFFSYGSLQNQVK